MKIFELYTDTPNGLKKAKRVYKSFKAGEKIEGIELEMQHANGNPIWVNLSVEPFRHPWMILVLWQHFFGCLRSS